MFLLTVVVIDDLAALLVIALGYSEDISVMALVVAIGLFGVLLALRWAGSWRGPAAVLVGIGIWFAMFESGVDAVIAGLAIGLITSAYPPSRDQLERSTELTRSFREQPTPELAYSARASLTSAISPNERLQYRLHPWTSRVIVPLFALANAGIHLDGDLLSSALDVAGDARHRRRLRGRQAASASSARRGWRRACGRRPADRHVAGARRRGRRRPASASPSRCWSPRWPSTARCWSEAKLGVLATAILSPVLAWVAIRVVRKLPADVRARQLGNTAETLVDLAEDVDPERDHIRGRPDAPVTLLEYGDFECPYCGDAAPTIARMLDHHGDALRYVFRHLPLTDVHPNAQMAAEAAEAAGAQGAFWEMHDRLLAHQDALAPSRPLPPRGRARTRPRAASRRTCAGAATRRGSREDVRSADASGVSGTPTFFINGRRHVGVYDIDTLTRAVKAARTAAAQRA